MLKLWVLEDVLTDFSDGMVCVLAASEEEAWEELKKKDRVAWAVLREFPGEPDTRSLDELPVRFKCVEKPEAFVVWGGG